MQSPGDQPQSRPIDFSLTHINIQKHSPLSTLFKKSMRLQRVKHDLVSEQQSKDEYKGNLRI